MSIQYPNGKQYHPEEQSTKASATSSILYGKRGMTLEEDVEQSNRYYKETKRAVIHKKPTPIQVVKVDYPRRSAAVIKEAYYRHSSTTDFNGIYKGLYLDFEAKETKNKQSFPLKNLHEHQVQHMAQCRELGGVTFLLIRFSTLQRVFLIGSSFVESFWNEQATSAGRKSIPLSFIEEKGFEIPYGYKPPLDYLTAVDQLLAQQQFV